MPSTRVDVIVTDGFTGNVALKTGEGTATLIRGLLREAFAYSVLSRVGALFALGSMRRLRKRIDPRSVNGGVFLGLNGTVIKSHGCADATGVSAAIRLGFTLADKGFAAAARRPRRHRRGRASAAARCGRDRDMSHAPRGRARLRPLPARARRPERRVRGDARHVGRVDPHPHRHRAAALRRRGRGDLRPRHRRRPGGARRCRPDRRGDRRDRAGHGDARTRPSRHRRDGAARDRHDAAASPSTSRRSAPASSSRSPRPTR